MAPQPLNRHFVSFPKSGRTWVRYMLDRLGLEQSIVFHHDGFEFNDGTRPELEFDVEARLRKYQAVDRLLYLERDPRDTIVSLFHQVTGRFADFFDYRAPISEFIRDNYFGAENLQKFREMWSEIAARRNVKVFSYEAFHENTVQQLCDVLDYYELPANTGAVLAAVEDASFENMRSKEASQTYREAWLRPRNGHYKVRNGKVGGYLNELSIEDTAYLNRIFFGSRLT